MKLIDMKRSKKEREAKNKPIEAGPYTGDEYGYGLRVRLENDDLKKLGLTPGSFKVGDKVHLHGKGVIKGLRHEQNQHRNDSHVEIQLHHVGVEPGSAGAAINKGISDADGDGE